MNQKKLAKPSTERQRGRPIDTGQQDLRSRILDEAEKLFSDRGYAATSIRQIADSAGVNPALVHYYFENKQSLLRQVMERVLEPLGEAIASLRDSPEATAADIARLLLSMAAKHPNIPRLLTREVLLPDGQMQHYFIKNLAPRLGGALPPLLSREKSAGRLREDFDPTISALLILGVSIFPFIARTLAEPILGINFEADGLKTLTRHITDLLERGMAV